VNELSGQGKQIRILVLCGGPSQEREVSLRSGHAVAKACRELGHKVIVSDVCADDLFALKQGFDIVFPVLRGEFGEDVQLQRILEDRGDIANNWSQLAEF
jgi:D-alanine-D-alanine ligase